MNVRRIIAASLLLGGCNELKEVGDSGSGGEIPAAVQAAFSESCALAGCHGAASPQLGLDLTPAGAPAILEATSIVGGMPLVTLGNVCQSWMAIKLVPKEVASCKTELVGLPMPPDPTDADRENVALILGWVAGAPLPEGDTGAGTSTGGGSGTGGGGGSDTGTAGGGGSDTGTTTGAWDPPGGGATRR